MGFAIGTALMIAFGTPCLVLADRRGRNPGFWGAVGMTLGPLALPFLLFATRQRR